MKALTVPPGVCSWFMKRCHIPRHKSLTLWNFGGSDSVWIDNYQEEKKEPVYQIIWGSFNKIMNTYPAHLSRLATQTKTKASDDVMTWRVSEPERVRWVKAHVITETEMSSFWWNFHHWLHWKLSFWQLQVQPLMKILSKWWHFRFSYISSHESNMQHNGENCSISTQNKDGRTKSIIEIHDYAYWCISIFYFWNP